MNKSDKAELKRLVKEKATREYFLEKMQKRLAKQWRMNQTKNRMYIETRKRYHIFINKIDYWSLRTNSSLSVGFFRLKMSSFLRESLLMQGFILLYVQIFSDCLVLVDWP